MKVMRSSTPSTFNLPPSSFASAGGACQTLLKLMPDSVALLQTMPRVLIADDQPAVIEALRLLLKGEGFETRAVPSPTDAAEALSRQSFDVALIDLNYTRDTTSGQEGLDLLARLREPDPTPPRLRTP